MRFDFKVEDPKTIRFSMFIEGTLREWEELQKGLKAHWPASNLSTSITEMYLKAAAHFSLDRPDEI